MRIDRDCNADLLFELRYEAAGRRQFRTGQGAAPASGARAQQQRLAQALGGRR